MKLKKASELVVGDIVYEERTIRPVHIFYISARSEDKHIHVSISDSNNQGSNSLKDETYIITNYNRFGDKAKYYTTEYEAKLRRKEDALEKLNELKDIAFKAIERVNAFRSKYYNELNGEQDLEKLRRQL